MLSHVVWESTRRRVVSLSSLIHSQAQAQVAEVSQAPCASRRLTKLWNGQRRRSRPRPKSDGRSYEMRVHVLEREPSREGL